MAKKLLLSFIISLMVSGFGPLLPAKVSALSGRVLITEVKLGGGSNPKEFVEIYNDTTSTVDLSKLTLDYAKPGFASDSCASTTWKADASPSTLVNTIMLSGSLEPGQFHVVEISMNDNTAGSLRLASLPPNPYVVQDVIGWGPDRPCYDDSSPEIALNGQSMQRPFGADGLPIAHFIFSAQNFITVDVPTPGAMNCLPTGCLVEEPEEAEAPDYEIQITELLPDPGPPKLDSLDEYIELYNPYDFEVNLTGYTLFTASPSATYQKLLDGIILPPQGYVALYSATTGLSLVNSSSGQAWLESLDNTKVFETPWYPANIGQDKAWALIDDTWQVTTTLTPGLPNASSPASSDPVTETTEQESSCPEGKFRNPETNRCKNIEEPAAGLTPCTAGQERNPATNRCRAVASPSSLTPCSAGQERNPETNRCRAVGTSSTTLTACQEGYERNPDTNRCRKIVAVKGASTQTPGDPSAKSALNYILIGSVSALVFSYAIYEYRKDILTTYLRFKNYTRRGAK